MTAPTGHPKEKTMENKKCDHCDGLGYVYGGGDETFDCRVCKGSGKIKKRKPKGDDDGK